MPLSAITTDSTPENPVTLRQILPILDMSPSATISIEIITKEHTTNLCIKKEATADVLSDKVMNSRISQIEGHGDHILRIIIRTDE